MADFEVRCSTSQWLHQARRGLHSCVQAAAAARVARRRDILKSAENGDGVSVLCYLIANADVNVFNRQGYKSLGGLPFTLNLFDDGGTPLHRSAQKGHLEVSRLLLECNADIGARDKK